MTTEEMRVYQSQRREYLYKKSLNGVFITHNETPQANRTAKHYTVYAVYDKFDNYHGEGNIYEIAEALGISPNTIYNRTFPSYYNKYKNTKYIFVEVSRDKGGTG